MSARCNSKANGLPGKPTHELGYGIRNPGARSLQANSCRLSLSRGVISIYAKLIVDSGLDWPAIAQFDKQALERELLNSSGKPAAFAPPDYGQIHEEVHGKVVPLMRLW